MDYLPNNSGHSAVVSHSQGYKNLSGQLEIKLKPLTYIRQSFKTFKCSVCNARPLSLPCPKSSLCALSRAQRRNISGREKLTFLFCAIGAINNDTYEKMNTNEIFKYMKTLARMHPRHRSRYSYTAYLHSTIPDPVQNRMIDKYVANF